jgi:aspartyl-tRNA(Asn)/glutamyl-tRNA(Gln) amidotransferase subunit C
MSPTSRITREEVERIARLARLELADDELAAMARDLGEVLAYAEQLRELDTSGIEATSQATALATPLREDRAADPLDPELALANAPVRAGTAFVVPKVIDADEEG